MCCIYPDGVYKSRNTSLGNPSNPRQDLPTCYLPRRSVEVLFLDDESNLPRARRSIRRRRMGIQFPSFFTGGIDEKML